MQKHLFMSYNSYGIPMNDSMKLLVRDSLVFDRSRHSIYTQGDEFGYVANVNQDIMLYDSYNNVVSGINLTVKNGVSSISNYSPLQLTVFKPVPESAEGLHEIGDTISITGFTYCTSGTSNVEEFWVTKNNETTYVLRNCISESVSGNTNTIVLPSVHQVTTNTTFTATAKDTKMAVLSVGRGEYDIPDNLQDDKSYKSALDTEISKVNYIAPAKLSFDVTFSNHVFLHNLKVTKSGSMNFDEVTSLLTEANIQNLLKGQAITNIEHTKIKDELTEDRTLGLNHQNQLVCTNGASTYVLYTVPKRIITTSDWNQLGLLNTGSAQEFEFVREFTYTNTKGYAELYHTYISTGQNWRNSKFYFD